MRNGDSLYDLDLKQADRRLNQLEIDVAFLRSCNLMDYSLLVGIERDEK